MTAPRRALHAWLGLTPEVERFGPQLAAVIADALGERDDDLGDARIAELIRSGDASAWMAYLSALTALIERGTAAGVARDESAILAGILRDQYRLAPGVLEMTRHDDARSMILEEMLDSR